MVALLVVTFLSQGPPAPSSPELPIERACWANVCGLQTLGANGRLGTAFIVRRDSDYFLVTAAHAARETKPQKAACSIGVSSMATRGSSSCTVFFPADVDPWQMYGTNDLAVAKIEPSLGGEELIPVCDSIAFDFDSLAAEPLPTNDAGRDCRLPDATRRDRTDLAARRPRATSFRIRS